MPQWLRIALMVFIATATLGLILYTFVRALRRAESPAGLILKWIITLGLSGLLFWYARDAVQTHFGAFAVPLLCVAFGVVMAFVWARHIGAVLASPFTSMFDGGSEESEAVPLYSQAEALRKRGKYREAVYAIQEQLEKFPKDFTGQMMLAEIQATNLDNLPGAENAIHRLCEQPGHSPARLAFAFNSLADWHLHETQDVDAARRALEKIIELFPDTEFERTAANRIAHLADAETYSKLREPERIALKPGVENLGQLKDQSHLLPKEKGPETEAAELAAHLDKHPLDHEARERLAVIYARHYQRLDLATEQLEQLIGLPNESPRHVARWLNLLADLQVHCTGRTDGAKQTLERLAEMFPGQAIADQASQRILALPLELKRYQGNRVVKMHAPS